jgi:hypothetical protein
VYLLSFVFVPRSSIIQAATAATPSPNENTTREIQMYTQIATLKSLLLLCESARRASALAANFVSLSLSLVVFVPASACLMMLTGSNSKQKLGHFLLRRERGVLLSASFECI